MVEENIITTETETERDNEFYDLALMHLCEIHQPWQINDFVEEEIIKNKNNSVRSITLHMDIWGGEQKGEMYMIGKAALGFLDFAQSKFKLPQAVAIMLYPSENDYHSTKIIGAVSYNRLKSLIPDTEIDKNIISLPYHRNYRADKEKSLYEQANTIISGLAHEFGELVIGHEMDTKPYDESPASLNWLKEFNADIIGEQLLMEYNPEISLKTYFESGQKEIFEYAESKENKNSPDTVLEHEHPPVSMRINLLKKVRGEL